MDSITRKRLEDKERGWAWVARRFDALAYRTNVRAWLQGSAIGDSDSWGRYTVTARSVGALTITLADGTTRDIVAPVPLA